MATATFGSPVKKLYGETVSLTTTAAHLLYRPNYHEIMLYCSSAWRMGLAPRLASVHYYNGTTYTNYTSQAVDRDSTTHVPLDAMTTAHTLYLGLTDRTRGFYFNLDGTNLNANAASLDWEYMYDISDGYYRKLTGTVSAALTVGETVTGQTSGATATHVYDNGSTYIIVKNLSGTFLIDEDVDGAAQTCDDISAIELVSRGTPYFTDVSTDADGTLTGTETLSQDGLYAFVLPTVARGAIAAISNDILYWYRFTPSATLSATIDVIDLIPACDTVNYGYAEAGQPYQFSLNMVQNGAFEFDHTGTGTLNVTWIQH